MTEYRKVSSDDGSATRFYFIVAVDDGRESIVCERMYEWAADWLLDLLAGHDYPEGPK